MKVLENGIIYHNPNSFFGYCGWPSVCKDDEGVLYAICSGFRLDHVCPFGKTVLFKSWDEGKTWSVPMVVNDSWMDDRDAGIVYLGGKSILVTWFNLHISAYSTGFKGYTDKWSASRGVVAMYDTVPPEYAQGGSYVRVSHDGGLTWGDVVRVPVSAPHGPILCRDGRLLYLGKEHCSYGVENPGVVAAWESRDQGATWTKAGEIPTPPAGTSWENFWEPHCLELPDGKLLGIIRAQGNEVAHGFTMYQSVSEDGGKTWSEMVCLGISGSPPHLLQHSSGAVVLVFGRREGPCEERAILSYDGGKTWGEEITLREGFDSDLGYPASVELSDGSIMTLYYQRLYKKDPITSLLCTRWQL